LKSWNKSNGAFKQAQYPRDLRVKWGGSKIRGGGAEIPRDSPPNLTTAVEWFLYDAHAVHAAAAAARGAVGDVFV